MSIKAKAILETISTLGITIKEKGEHIVKVSNIPTINPDFDSSSSLTNATLLLDTLESFYSDEAKASYLPLTIDSVIEKQLSNVTAHLNSFITVQSNQAEAKAVLSGLDSLYAVSMQYGLITFGFAGKDMTEIVTEMRSHQKKIRKISNAVEEQAQVIKETADNELSDYKQKFELLHNNLIDIQKEYHEKDALLQNRHQELNNIYADCEKMRKDIIEHTKNNLIDGDEIDKLKKSIDEIQRSATVELESIKNYRANAKNEMDTIISFYTDIEAHQKIMREVQKDAKSKYETLETDYDTLKEDLKTETNAIIEKNKDLQIEIKEHLQKAIGASLFSAFERRSNLKGKRLWFILMIIALGGATWLSFFLADALNASNGLGAIFFIRLSALVPVTIVIAFAAKQYSNERRTEEEYAFKSAISMSLEPYKDLLQRMKEEGHVEEAIFVEKLLLEIFDNPVKRIFPHEQKHQEKQEENDESLECAIKRFKPLLSLPKDIDPEAIGKVIDLVAKVKGYKLES